MSSSFHHNPRLIQDESNYHDFVSKIRSAVKTVRKILETTRNPRLASPTHKHHYLHKYTLSELITNAALTSLLHVLVKLGLGAAPPPSSGGGGTTTMLAKPPPAAMKTIETLAKLVQNDKK